MFWIAIAIVVVGYFWYRSTTTQNQALPQPSPPQQRLPAVPLQRDPATFRSRVTRAFEAGDLPLVVATIDQELRPALSDVADATKAMYEKTLSSAGRADRVQVAAQRARHFAAVARCLDLLASKINGQPNADAPSAEVREQLAAETLETRLATALDDVVAIVHQVEKMDSLRSDPVALLLIARKILDAAERLLIRLTFLQKEVQTLVDNLEQTIATVSPDASTFGERFMLAFDSEDYGGAVDVVAKEMGHTVLLAIKRAAELHDHMHGTASNAQNRRCAKALLASAEHFLDVTHALVMLATKAADMPEPTDFTPDDNRMVLARLGERMKQDGWGGLVVEAFVEGRKKWETTLDCQSDAKAYATCSERLRWHALECWLWARLTVAQMESPGVLTET